MPRPTPGLAHFSHQNSLHSSYQTLSNDLSAQSLSTLHSQLATFRTHLQTFATTHRSKIRQDPNFRHAFQQMCASIGVDPLAGAKTRGAMGLGGLWEGLGLGEWMIELGVQVVDVCVSTRERNGGLITMEELIRIISRLRGLPSPSSASSSSAGAITEDDIAAAIRTLAPLNAGYTIITLPPSSSSSLPSSQNTSRKLIRSVPSPLDSSILPILSLAHLHNGRLSVSLLVSSQGWSVERARTALDNMLLRDGTCWLDEQDEGESADGEPGGRAYWVPAAMRWED